MVDKKRYSKKLAFRFNRLNSDQEDVRLFFTAGGEKCQLLKNKWIRVLVIGRNRAVHKRGFYLLVLAYLSCSPFHDKNQKSNTPLKVKLVLERGAFHYDRFVLEDTTITYYPSPEGIHIDNEKYHHLSTKVIPTTERNTLIHYLIDQGIYDLSDSYHTSSTCTSSLKVTFELNGKVKQITAEDFKRGCPEVLQFLEHQVVLLHGKGLERVMLPG